MKRNKLSSKQILMVHQTNNSLKNIWIWVGKQNAFLVVFALFLIFFAVYKSFDAVLKFNASKFESSDTEEYNVLRNNNGQDSGVGSYGTWESAFISPTKILPTITSFPTIDTDPVIDCQINTLCGGNTVKLKKSDCLAQICCSTEPGKYESLSSSECAWRQADYRNKRDSEKMQISPFPTFAPYPTYAPIPTQKTPADYRAPVVDSTKYQDCIADVEKKYQEMLLSASLSMAEGIRDGRMNDCAIKYQNLGSYCVAVYSIGDKTEYVSGYYNEFGTYVCPYYRRPGS